MRSSITIPSTVSTIPDGINDKILSLLKSSLFIASEARDEASDLLLFIEFMVLSLARANCSSSQRGSSRISFTRSTVASKCFDRELTFIVMFSVPEDMEIEAPSKPIASSNSSGVLFFVPSRISEATRLDRPAFSIGSAILPPSNDIEYCIIGNSCCSTPHIFMPLSIEAFQIGGIVTSGSGPNCGAIERSKLVGVFKIGSSSTVSIFTSAALAISSSTTPASMAPSAISPTSPFGTKLVSRKFLFFMYFSYTLHMSLEVTF